MNRYILSALLALLGIAIRPDIASAQAEAYLGEIRLFGMSWCPVDWVMADGGELSITQYAALYSLFGAAYGGNGTTTFKLPDLRGRAPVNYHLAATPPVTVGKAYGADVSTSVAGSATGSVTGTAKGDIRNINVAGVLTYTTSSSVTLTANNLPAHTHQLNATTGAITNNSPKGNLLATYGAGAKIFSATGAAPDAAMAANAIANNTTTNTPVSVPINLQNVPISASGSATAVNLNVSAAPDSSLSVKVPTQSPVLAMTWCVCHNGYYPIRP